MAVPPGRCWLSIPCLVKNSCIKLLGFNLLSTGISHRGWGGGFLSGCCTLTAEIKGAGEAMPCRCRSSALQAGGLCSPGPVPRSPYPGLKRELRLGETPAGREAGTAVSPA